jgi:transcriptional regulator with XRE-family HTH domain
MEGKMKDPFKVKLGERIRALRKEAGLTQEQLAEKAGVSVNFIGNAERGESAASVKTLRKIVKAIGVNLKDLFDFLDEDANEIIDEIITLLKSKRWEIEELKMLRSLVKIIGLR